MTHGDKCNIKSLVGLDTFPHMTMKMSVFLKGLKNCHSPSLLSGFLSSTVAVYTIIKVKKNTLRKCI